MSHNFLRSKIFSSILKFIFFDYQIVIYFIYKLFISHNRKKWHPMVQQLIHTMTTPLMISMRVYTQDNCQYFLPQIIELFIYLFNYLFDF